MPDNSAGPDLLRCSAAPVSRSGSALATALQARSSATRLHTVRGGASVQLTRGVGGVGGRGGHYTEGAQPSETLRALGQLFACCAHSTVAVRVEVRLATGDMGRLRSLGPHYLGWSLRGGAARRGELVS